MKFSEQHCALLRSISDEWNKAERDIKLAEQVANGVVIPAVKELRYAGRRLVDALIVLDTEPDEDRKVVALLEDARFDCHRARHDAIDASTAKIALSVDVMTSKLGYDVVLTFCPGFPALVQALNDVRGKIAISRENRLDREAIYGAIEAGDFPALVKQYGDLMKSEPMMIAMAKKGRQRDFFGKYGFWVGVAGLILGCIGLVVSIIPFLR